MGHNMLVLDNLRSGFEDNLSDLPVNFLKGDIRDQHILDEIPQDIEVIFHLAALVSVPESLSKVRECVDINTIGTINVLERAKRISQCKVVLSSSAANYGDNPVLPKIETMRPEPATPYSVTKLDGEYYLDVYNREWGLPTASLRYFNVFGPRQNPKSQYAAAVPIFITRALKNEPIIIYGDGNQTRDFIYVKDVVKANLMACQKGAGTYNVALGNSISILELAEKIISLTNSKSCIEFQNERPGDIKHSLADTGKFQALGFKPDYTLDDGLTETIHYYDLKLASRS